MGPDECQTSVEWHKIVVQVAEATAEDDEDMFGGLSENLAVANSLRKAMRCEDLEQMVADVAGAGDERILGPVAPELQVPQEDCEAPEWGVR
jgi:hypothetical protein